MGFVRTGLSTAWTRGRTGASPTRSMAQLALRKSIPLHDHAKQCQPPAPEVIQACSVTTSTSLLTVSGQLVQHLSREMIMSRGL